MTTHDTAGTARGEMTMDDETTRLRRSRTARSRARLRARHGGGSVTREDLRPRAETTLRDLCALLYPATVGHDVVVYAAGDGPWSARWRWAARVVEGRVVGETGALTDGERARVLAWARREMMG